MCWIYKTDISNFLKSALDRCKYLKTLACIFFILFLLYILKSRIKVIEVRRFQRIRKQVLQTAENLSVAKTKPQHSHKSEGLRWRELQQPWKDKKYGMPPMLSMKE